MSILRKSLEEFVAIRYNPEILRKLDRSDDHRFMFIGKKAKKRTFRARFLLED